jgi:cytidylate kinase
VDRPIAEVEAEMQARDAQDAARATAPMKPAEDAVVLDTTELGIEEAFQAARALVRARLG